MAANKAKRSIPSVQPERRGLHAEVSEAMPVKSHVYRIIAELNCDFEKVIQDLHPLGSIGFFRSSSAPGMHRLISRIRAQLNQEFASILRDRERANSGHFDRLYSEHEKRSSKSTNR